MGFRAGDALRFAARTPRRVLPGPKRLTHNETIATASVVRREGLRGGLLSYDGQVEDDARLVTALARTAAGEGASILTRVRVLSLAGGEAEVRDELTGATGTIRAKVVVNAAGVWADQLSPEISLRPSRGTHVVLRGSALPGLRVQLTAPVPDEFNRFVFALPQPDGTIYIGLTDEPQDGPVPDVPVPTDQEIDFLLATIGGVLEHPLDRSAVVGAYAGLRPLLQAEGKSADLSRKHAVLTGPTGVITIVGGKLTTYRRMAEDTVDAVVATGRVQAGPCRTKNFPLVGAGPTDHEAPPRLVRKYGSEAGEVVAAAVAMTGATSEEVAEPISAKVPVSVAELVWAISHEGAVDADDVLDRRTRIGLIPEDRAATAPVVASLFTQTA
jgi:glycerol-3-phosphate dehydrogenase